MEKRVEFVRQQFSGSGLMYLFCAGCGKLVAYSARADVMSIAEDVHRKLCPGRKSTLLNKPNISLDLGPN